MSRDPDISTIEDEVLEEMCATRAAENTPSIAHPLPPLRPQTQTRTPPSRALPFYS